jgi:hypothetical protein
MVDAFVIADKILLWRSIQNEETVDLFKCNRYQVKQYKVVDDVANN